MSKKVILKSFDGASFEIDEAVAVYSTKIAHMIDGYAKTTILLGRVKGSILSMVVEYCKKQVEAAVSSNEETKEELKKWEGEFMKGMDDSTLSEVISAAEYLNLKDLADLACLTIADMLFEATRSEQTRTFLNMEIVDTPEEEEAVRKE